MAPWNFGLLTSGSLGSRVVAALGGSGDKGLVELQ